MEDEIDLMELKDENFIPDLDLVQDALFLMAARGKGDEVEKIWQGSGVRKSAELSPEWRRKTVEIALRSGVVSL